MAFTPKGITRDHVLEAVKYIEKEKFELNKSTRWLVKIAGKTYPPKEIMRYSHAKMNGEHTWEYGGGKATNKFLSKLGFDIIDTREESNLANVIIAYKKAIKETSWLDDEIYKFEWANWLNKNVNFFGQSNEEIYELCMESHRQRYSNSVGVQFIKQGAREKLSKYIGVEDIKIFRDFYNGMDLEELDCSARNMSFPILSCWLSVFIPDLIFPASRTSFANIARALFNKELPNSGMSFLIGMQEPMSLVSNVLFEDKEIVSILCSKLNKPKLNEVDINWLVQDFFLFVDRNIDTLNINTSKDMDVAKTEYKPALNQIFYGPPGTGKTYNTVLEAAKIVTQDPTISYSDALEVFNTNLGGQIEFVTFHQNYSYEDFIQGLRPETENSSELSFYKRDGVFKRIADKAKDNYQTVNKKVRLKKEFNEVFKTFIEPLIEGDEIEVKMKKVSYFITNVSERSIEFRKASGGTGHTLSISTLRTMYNHETTDVIIGLTSYYQPLLDSLLHLGKLDEVEAVDPKDYVIIIDEINRANISRVFGELITLIEKDKRLGGQIPIKATLPSGDSFIVPPNLYIIGTMNTADKSIALLDIALRRRFEFVPMYPDSSSNEGKVVHDSHILDGINKEIIDRKGYDFTIGHSYFMGTDYNLKNTIDNKVIPLLLEYFMNDFKEVKSILKNGSDLNIDGWPMQLVVND